MGLGPAGAVLGEGVGRVRFELRQETRPERSDFVGGWSRPRRLGQIAGLPATLEPAFDGAERDQELLSDLGPGHPTVHGIDDSDPEILRIGLHTHSMPERATL
jgi:hypothetical protein